MLPMLMVLNDNIFQYLKVTYSGDLALLLMQPFEKKYNLTTGHVLALQIQD